MNKIMNWVFGSFFRTIGRLLVFVVIGFVIAHFIDFRSIIADFSIADFFGIQKVSAAVLTETVKNKGTSYLRTVQSGWTNTDGFYETTVQSSANEIVKTLTFDYDIGATQHDYIQINITASNPNASSVNQSSTVTGGDVCTRWKWRTIDSYNNVIEWGCERFSTNPDSTINDREYIQNLLSGYNFMATVNFAGGWAACTFQDNAVFCPTNRSQVNSIDFHIMYNSNYSSSFNLGVHRSFVFYDYDNTGETIIQQQQATNNAINNQTQQQQQQHNEMMNDTVQDSNETESAFEDFESFLPENGIITQLITLPITLYTNILNSVNASCSAFSLGNIFGKPLTLPCINISNYLGSNLWGVIDILMSGFFVLVIARKLIKVFNSMSSMKEGDVLGD